MADLFFNQTPPNNPEPPKDTTPTTPPPPALKSRVVSIPIVANYENIPFKGSSDGAFRFIGMGGLIVEYRTTEPANVAYKRIQQATNDFFRNRGYVLPQNQADMDFAAGWVAYFYRMILRQQGLDVTISSGWVSEEATDRTLVFYTKAFPVGTNGASVKVFKREVRRGNAKVVTW